VQEQDREQRALLARPEIHDTAVRLHLERPEEPVLHLEVDEHRSADRIPGHRTPQLAEPVGSATGLDFGDASLRAPSTASGSRAQPALNR
jgi:hypothetical protein